MNKTITITILIILVLGGAALVYGRTQRETRKTNSAENSPEGSLHNLPVPEPVRLARIQAAKEAGVPEGQAVAMFVEEKEWPDGCLGLAKSGEFCTQAIVSGYKIEVSAGDKTFVYRTNLDGTIIKREK